MGFIPGVIAVASMAAGMILSGFFDWNVIEPSKKSAFDPRAASAVLTTLAGGAITVAALVLSITMVVLSSASSQYGPRLLPNFIRKPGTKLAMGGFFGSFAYQIMVASALGLGERVPDLAVWVGIFGSLGAFAILLVFVHMVAKFIQVPFIIDEVTSDLHKALKEAARVKSEAMDSRGSAFSAAGPSVDLIADQDGYIQVIHTAGLIDAAREMDGIIVSTVGIGSFVPRGGLLAKIHGRRPDDEEADALRGFMAVGPSRTESNDTEYAIRQLVEIAVRALSPGINDPHTAINAIERLGGAFAGVAATGVSPGILTDEEGCVRLVIPLPSVSDLFDAAYHPLRQHARGVEEVAIALLDSYRMIAALKLHADVKSALERHAEFLRIDFENESPAAEDLRLFHLRFQDFKERLADQESKA